MNTTGSPYPSPELVTEEQHCRACGYSIAGLPADGRCPECGKPVEESLRSDLMRFASRDYVGKLYRGAAIVFWITILSLVVGILGSFVLGGVFGPTQGGVASDILSFVFQVGLLYGWWVLTTPDPGNPRESAQFGARMLVRITVAVNVGLAALSLALVALWTSGAAPQWPGGGPSPMGAFTVMAVFGFIAVIAQIVFVFATLVYVRKLATRFPDDQLAARAKSLMWLLGSIFVVGMVSLILRTIVPILGVFMLVVGVLGIVAFVMYITMLYRLQADLKYTLDVM